MSVRVIENFLAPESHEQISAYLRGPGWAYGAYSDSNAPGIRYWYKHFAGMVRRADEDASQGAEQQLAAFPPIAAMWAAIRDGILPGHELIRSYANGYPYGADGGVHLDADVPGHLTALYFAHPRWEPNWGGETVFFDREQKDVVATAYARPNRLVIFPGDLPHVARGVSRSCEELRITLMFKVREAS
ncbi:2OG-Fe(II) oxygenase [Sphingomonas tabacisoli]|uniref:2OG-Fe(II) oxygenase n=1 Tax=Sphingomonas tabacisoli TaxID=2249466 RepID=A0ABW4I790_9SPHN